MLHLQAIGTSTSMVREMPTEMLPVLLQGPQVGQQGAEGQPALAVLFVVATARPALHLATVVDVAIVPAG